MAASLDDKLDAIARHPFRAKFQLAQHATATCCRSCLERSHQIPKGRELSREEVGYVVDVICRWIEREVAGVAAPPTSS